MMFLHTAKSCVNSAGNKKNYNIKFKENENKRKKAERKAKHWFPSDIWKCDTERK